MEQAGIAVIAPDADLPTLHIRCGSDIRDKLAQAGFVGEFLEYADPVCEGPVPDMPDLIPIRATYLASQYGAGLNLSEPMLITRLRQQDDRLAAAQHYQRVVLWFEHDSYDQLVLARCLSRLAETAIPGCLELICIDTHPSVPRFNGLGQLEPAALAGLWPRRTAVTASQIALAQSIWAALRQPDPGTLQSIARTGTPALPIAAPALWRHLRELPGTADGLSLTQRLILTIMSEAPTRIGEIFNQMAQGREPLVFMGDLGFRNTIEAMARTDPPVLTITSGAEPFARQAIITATGQDVLLGRIDYLTLAPAERWVGAVRIAAATPSWRFNETTQRVHWHPAPAP